MSAIQKWGDLLLEDDVRRGPRIVVIEGRGVLRGGVALTYSKSVVVVEERGSSMLWATSAYRYNAHIIGLGPLMRYDNGNGEKHYPEHPTAHHKHLFQWDLPKDQQPQHVDGYPVHTGEQYPTLAKFVEEVFEWAVENRDKLPRPEWMPELDDVQLGYV